KHGWLIPDVPIEIQVAAIEAQRILGRPPSSCWVVIARPEVHEPRITVIEATGEAEGLEAGVGVVSYPTEGVVVHLLGDGAGGHVHHEARTAQVVGDDAIRLPALPHVLRYVAARPVHEAADDVTLAAQFSTRARLGPVEKALHERPIYLLANAPTEAIDQ